MPCAHHRAVVLIVESCASEVDQIDVRAKQDFPELGRARRQSRGRRDIAVVGEGLVCVVEQEDVLGLQVRVDEVEIVQEGNGAWWSLLTLLQER